MTLLRGCWKTDVPLERDSSTLLEGERTPVRPFSVDSLEEATLIGSELPSGKHAPVIDIDLPCELVPSSTPGHFHLYIDKAISWSQYTALLKALVDAEIVEEGYYKASLSHGRTFVRKPGLTKRDS